MTSCSPVPGQEERHDQFAGKGWRQCALDLLRPAPKTERPDARGYRENARALVEEASRSMDAIVFTGAGERSFSAGVHVDAFLGLTAEEARTFIVFEGVAGGGPAGTHATARRTEQGQGDTPHRRSVRGGGDGEVGVSSAVVERGSWKSR